MGIVPDIAFLSYDEPNAERNFLRLQRRYSRVKRLHQVTGVGRANILTAELVDTDWYYIVDADNIVSGSVCLNQMPAELEKARIIIWSAINPVNGLIYGYGGIKLCHRSVVRSLKPDKEDVFGTLEQIPFS